MAWLSLLIIEIAPRSCRMSSAAMVSRRIRLSAKARSSGWRVEVVADHQHVEMLVERVDGVGRSGWSRTAARWPATTADDVGRVAAAGALGVEGVDGAALNAASVVLDEARLVERVGVDRDLMSICSATAQAVVDRRRRGAPVLVQLHADRAGLDLLEQALRLAGVALAEEAEVHRKASAACSMRSMCQGAAGAGGGVGAGGRPVPPPIMVVMPEYSASSICCGQMKWIWLSMAAGGDDHAFAGDHLGAGADHDVDAGLDVGVAGLAD